MEPYCVGFERHKTVPLPLPADPIRMISVSTTLSASEFTENAGITQSKTNTKQSFKHRLFAPRTVVLDPAATLDTPDWLLFCTGIRSVDHAVENYCNERASLATEALSLQGLKLLSRALPAIKRSPSELAPRLEAQIGMWQAIAPSASGVPTGASHGIGYALGATFGVHLEHRTRLHLERTAHEVSRNRQLAPAAIAQRRQPNATRPPKVEQAVDRGAHGSARVQHVIHEHDVPAIDSIVDLAWTDLRIRQRHRRIVAVEGDIDGPNRDGTALGSLDLGSESRGDGYPAAPNANQAEVRGAARYVRCRKELSGAPA